MPPPMTLTAPPTKRSPHYSHHRELPDSGSHQSLADVYASIWNIDCSGEEIDTKTSSRVFCFTSELVQFGQPVPSTFSDPDLTFLSLVQTAVPAAISSPASSSADSALLTETHFLQLTSDSSSPRTTPPSLSSAASSPSSSPNTGAIVGGVVGGVALLALCTLAFFPLRRHIRRSRAPSAEFMHMARNGSPSFSFTGKRTEDGAGIASRTRGDRLPLARQGSIEDDERPPAFTPGTFKDPVYEKVSESAAMRERYEARDVEGGGYKD